MAQNSKSNKRIVKNTIFMYFRMIFMMFIGLYTSRVILNALGISDLGLMNVAGSAVGMFSFMNDTLTSGTQRFISYAIGEGNKQKLKKTFECAFTLHVILSAITLILCETIGLWYVNNNLVVEPGRFQAALWCYQLSALSVFIGIIQIPFRSALVAHEKLGIYAFISIFDAAARLLTAYIIQIVPWDRVIFYSTLCFFISFIPIFIYNSYCQRKFDECSFKMSWNKEIAKNMLSFSGWNTFGSMVGSAQGTGINLVLNSFCGTIINGSRGIAMHANNWVMKFVDNFLIALNPQIIKSYSAGDYKRTNNLITYGALFGSYLILFLGVPLFIEIEWVLKVWLGQCPEHSIAFMRIAMIEAFFRTMGTPTVVGMHATGELKYLNIIIAPILLLTLPLSYVLLKYGMSPEHVLFINVIPWMVVPYIRILLLNKYSKYGFPIKDFVIKVLIRTPVIAIIVFIPPLFVSYSMSEQSSIFRFICVGFSHILFSSIIIYFLGIDKKTRDIFNAIIKNFIKYKSLKLFTNSK